MAVIFFLAASFAAKDVKSTYEFEQRRVMLSAEYRDGHAHYCRFQVGGHLGSVDCGWIDPFVRSAWEAYTDQPLPTDRAVSFETAVEPNDKPKRFPRKVPAGGQMIFYQAMTANVGSDGRLADCQVTVATDEANDGSCAWPAYYRFDPVPAEQSVFRVGQFTVGLWTEPRLFRGDSDTGYIGAR